MSVQSIENATLGHYIGQNTRQLRLDRQRGRADGKRDFPALDDDHHSFLEEVCANARAALQEFDTRIGRHVADLQQKLEERDAELNEGYVGEREDLISRKQEALTDLDQTLGPSSFRMKRAQQDAEEAARAHRKLQSELNRPLRVQLRHLYWPLMLVAFLFEAPLNRLAFELYFQETALISWAIAAFVGAIFLVLAHFVGQGAKRFPNLQTWLGRVFSGTLIAGAIALAFVLMYFVAKVRQAFLLFIEGERAFEGNLGALLRGESISLPGFQELLQVPLSQDGYLFILINFAIFVVAVVLSYVRYDPHPDYEHLERQHQRADKKLSQLKERFESENSKINKYFNAQIEHKDRNIDNMERDVQKLNAEILAAQEARVSNTVRVAKSAHARVTNYQSGNVEARSDGKMPHVFKNVDENVIIERVALGPLSSDDVGTERQRARTGSR